VKNTDMSSKGPCFMAVLVYQRYCKQVEKTGNNIPS